MKTRPLTDNEINLLKASTELVVYQCLIEVAYRTGFRISELLSMKLDDVLNTDGTVKRSLSVARGLMKGGHSSRSVPLHESAREAIALYLQTRPKGNVYLWVTLSGSTIRRQHFHYALKWLADKAGIEPDRVASHSFRKSFAKGIYERSGQSLTLTQKALGHKAITSTISYLEVDSDEVDRLILDAS